MTGGFRRVGTPNVSRGSASSRIDAAKLRMRMVEQDVVTFRVTCKNGPMFERAMEHIFGPEEYDVQLVKVDGDYDDADKCFTMPGLRGVEGRGAYIRVSKDDAIKITKAGAEVAGVRAWQEKLDAQEGGRVEIGVTWDPCGGLPTMCVGAVWGLDGNKVLDESGGYFPARAARLTSAVATQMLKQLDRLPEDHYAKVITKYGEHLPVKATRQNLGQTSIAEGEPRRDTWGYKLHCAAEDIRLKRFLVEDFDWATVAEALGSVEEIKIVNDDEYLCLLAEKHSKEGPRAEVEDIEVTKRTLMYWNIKDDVTEEKLREAAWA